MLFSMKLSRDEIKVLARKIDGQRRKNNISFANLARLAEVHPSQAQRVCHAEFRTLSGNVMRICTVLKIDPMDAAGMGATVDPNWLELQRAVRAVWDGTPAGADAITQLLRAATAIRLPD